MRRVFASFLMVWFAVIMAEPAALHACAMHDGTATHAAHGAPAAQDPHAAHDPHAAQDPHAAHDPHVAHDPHAAHGAATGAAEDASTQVPADAPASACTCLGECCAASVAPLPQVAVALVAPQAVRMAGPVFPPHPAGATSAPGLCLPFATAPPVLPA